MNPTEKRIPAEREGVQDRCREALLAYGLTSCLSERYDIYKKGLKADYAQGHNRYRSTVVESYQMALDVMRIYQKSPSQNQNSSNKERETNDHEGASFAQKEDEKKCFKYGAKDYKSCPCDNMKRVREREQRKKDKDTEEQHLQVADTRTVHFA